MSNIDEVLKELVSITEWQQLSLALKLAQRVIDDIEYKYPHNLEGCRREMVTHWLRKSPNVEHPSWKTLVEALRSDLVAENALANKIATKHKNFAM